MTTKGKEEAACCTELLWQWGWWFVLTEIHSEYIRWQEKSQGGYTGQRRRRKARVPRGELSKCLQSVLHTSVMPGVTDSSLEGNQWVAVPLALLWYRVNVLGPESGHCWAATPVRYPYKFIFWLNFKSLLWFCGLTIDTLYIHCPELDVVVTSTTTIDIIHVIMATGNRSGVLVVY